MTRWCALIASVMLLLAAATADAADVQRVDGLTIVYLEGKPYNIGRRHGQLLRPEIEQSVHTVLTYFRDYLKIPLIGPLAADWWLDWSWARAWKYIPTDYVEELLGISDGSGVPLRDVWRLHAIPDRTYSCTNLAVWGKATADGRLFHVRNLDWNINAGIQRFPVVYVVHPNGKQAFVNVSWAGFVGVLTGVNERAMSIGQVGAETSDTTFRGIPMAFLMRRVLEHARSLDEAEHVIVRSPRTVGTNYVIADGLAKRAIAIETTQHFATVFEANDPKEQKVSYARPMQDAVFRADTAMDLTIRNEQYASGGNPNVDGLEPPTGSAYETRYLGTAADIKTYYGELDVERAKRIARRVAPTSNVQSVIFSWPDVWIANAQGTTPAADSPYVHLNLSELLAVKPPRDPNDNKDEAPATLSHPTRSRRISF